MTAIASSCRETISLANAATAALLHPNRQRDLAANHGKLIG
jgi:hypothetical protein